MRLIRSRAQEWGIDSARLGAIGFSAGGELVALIGMKGGDGPADDESRRIAGILSDAVPVIAIDDFRVRADGLPARLDQYAPGKAVTLLIARRDELLRLPVTLGREPVDTWRLEIRPDATAEQQAHRKAWSGDVVPVTTP